MSEVALHDLVDAADLASAIEARLINVRESDDGLRIYNYSDLAVYTPGAWDNPAVRQCRGLVVDESGHVVARPWAKFFNHGQAEAGDLDLTGAVEVTDKVDGSLGIVYPKGGGRIAVATRGSFVSEQAVHATELIQHCYGAWTNLRWLTVLVEIVYPQNRIVCDYGDLDDLILLGGVEIATGDYYGPAEVAKIIEWEGPVAETFPYATLADALSAPPRDGAEGLCVRYLNEPRIVKIKQEEYVRLHRLVTGLSERVVWEHMLSGQPVEALLDGIPDELHGWVRSTWQSLAAEAGVIYDVANVAHRRIVGQLGEGLTRKDYAALASKQTTRPYLFMLLDGRDPMPAIVRSLKPAGDTRFKIYSEDVA